MKQEDYLLLKRLINLIIDGVLIILIWLAFLYLAALLIYKTGLISLFAQDKTYQLDFTLVVIIFMYYLIFESIFNTTPGKIITRTKIVREDGETLNFYNIFIRSIVRLIPFDPFTYLSESKTGWHDRFSKTKIINKKQIENINKTTGGNSKS